MKNTVKRIISTVAFHLKLWDLLYYLLPILGKKYILGVATFHRVIPREKTVNFVANYDKGQDVRRYNLLLRQLSRYFDFISLDDFIDYLTGLRQLKKHSILFTYDDADADFANYAFPILKENNWPAVIFAPTGCIETDLRFWHLRVTNMMHQMDAETWQLIAANKTTLPEGIRQIIEKYPAYDKSLYHPVTWAFLRYFHELPDNDIIAIVDKLEKLIKSKYTLGIGCLSWIQLELLEKEGIAIESHTVNHRRLTYLDRTEMMAELVDSKSTLENRLGKNVKAFCYPSGAFNNQVIEAVNSAGYLVAFTTETGRPNYPVSGSARFKIPRLDISGDDQIEMNFEIGRLILQ